MYQNYYPSYNAYAQAQPYQTMPQVAQQPQTAQSNIIWATEEEAKSYLVGAGNSVIIMDSQKNTFYVKSTDNAGMPQPMRTYDYTERKAQAPATNTADYITREEFEKRFAELKEAKADE